MAWHQQLQDANRVEPDLPQLVVDPIFGGDLVGGAPAEPAFPHCRVFDGTLPGVVIASRRPQPELDGRPVTHGAWGDQ